jgi:glycosyltransferase involved in cell wall biosynthesis
MRIAIFSEVYWPMVSGVGVTLRRLADSLEAAGHAVRVCTATYPLPEAGDRPEVHRSPSLPLFLYRDVQWAFPRHRELVAEIAAFRPDVVHVATEFALGVAGLRVARELGVPVVASAHTDYEQYAARYGLDWALRPGWRYLRWFYGQAERVLCPSRIYEEHLHSRGVERTGIWTRGVDTAAFHPRHRDPALRESLGVSPGESVVTYVGRLAREKNLDLLLDAWQSVAPRHPGARLALVGRGPLEDEIRRRAIPGVELLGLLTGNDLSAAYASADLFAFPSVTETFGNVLLEAMASGLPSVVAAAGGVLDFVEHGRNAWLVAPSSVQAMTDGLKRLLTDAALRRRLSAGALDTAAARRWDAIDELLFEEYRRVARAGRRLDRAA